MQYEFLKQFPKRMKTVGLYAILIQNSAQKMTWQKYGFSKVDEQINLIFSVLLYIMEQSLREENCTKDDIGAFIDTLNQMHFGKDMTYGDCKNLGDFVLNVVLSNEGKAMYFDCYDFEQNAYHIVNISYVANRIVYVEEEVKRTSYYLTDDGYNLLLGTLEIENNMQLTIHEMIFKMHLEKQSYDKAVDEIKNVFNLLRIQIQKIQEAMGKIRRNALNYTVADYHSILDENLETISDTKQKFQNYRELVKSRAKELEEEKINVRRLSAKEEEKLDNLRLIESYLTRAIDEHQRILNGHFDLKALYTRELEQLSQMSLIRRFPMRSGLYDEVLAHPESLERLDYFLRPLFGREPDKIYNLNKALELQRPVRRRAEEDDPEVLDFDEEAWQEEQERKVREKLKKYEESLSCILEMASGTGQISLLEIRDTLCREEEAAENMARRKRLIPNTEIFKEIMVELIKNREMDIRALRRERSEYIQEKAESFQLNEMLLDLTQKDQNGKDTDAGTSDGRAGGRISKIEAYRLEDGNDVIFDHVLSEDGSERTIRCSNVMIRVIREEEE